ALPSPFIQKKFGLRLYVESADSYEFNTFHTVAKKPRLFPDGACAVQARLAPYLGMLTLTLALGDSPNISGA
ncbi:MAG: hypothetical protein RR283_06975, partial [Comamonas sp.]